MKPRHSIRRILPLPALILAGSFAALLAPSAQAANRTWSGATATWNTNTNWVGGVLPASNDVLIFDVAGAGGLLLNNDLTSAAFNVAGITFNGPAPAYVIGDGTTTPNLGNTFVLTGNVTNNSSKLQTLNTPFSTTAVRTFSASIGDFILTGNISGTNGGVLKVGVGTLVLSGTNSYTGASTAQGGVLLLNSANAIPGGIGATGGTGALVMNTGVVGLGDGGFSRSLAAGVAGVTFAGNGGWAAYSADRVVNLGGAGASVIWQDLTTGFNAKTLILGAPTSTHTVDLQNPIDLGSVARSIQVDNGSAVIDGKLSGNLTGIAGGNLTKLNAGTLVLSGNNDYVGTTAVNAGTLRIDGIHSGTGAISIAAGATLGGAGTLGGAVTAAVGNTNSPGGAINLENGAVGILKLNSDLTFSGTAALPNNLCFDLGNSAGGTDKIVATGIVTATTANAVIIDLNQLEGDAINPGTYPLIQGGASSTGSGYKLATTRAGGNVYTLEAFAANTLSLTVAAGNAGPTAAFAFWQGDTAVWNTAQWYSDIDGTIPTAAAGFESNIRFGTTTAGNLATNLGQDYDINSLTVDAGIAAVSVGGSSNMLAIGATAANSNTVGNGITVNNTAGTTIASKVGMAANQIWTVGTAAALTVSGAVSDFGGGYSLTKAGAGTLTLTGGTSFSGKVEIAGGTLTIGGAGRLGDTNYYGNILNNGSLGFNSTVSQNLYGTISGSGQLIKSGGGQLALYGNNTYTGGTIISGGILYVPPVFGGRLAPGSNVTINTGGTLKGEQGYFTGGTLTMNGGAWSENNGFGGGWTGAVVLAAANSFFAGPYNQTITGNISGPGGFTKSSGNTLTLNGVNTYEGLTVISQGTVSFPTSAALYNADTSKWTPENITVASGGAIRVKVGGVNEFTGAEISTLLGNLGTVNNNGLKAGAAFGFDMGTAGAAVVNVTGNIVDSVGPGGGMLSITKFYVGNSAGVLQFSGANTYSGITRHEDGILRVTSINSVADNVGLGTVHSASSSLGAPTTVATGTIYMGNGGGATGGTLQYLGSGETTDRVLNFAGQNNSTNVLDQSGGGLLKFVSPFSMQSQAKLLILQGSTAGTGEIPFTIPNPSGTTTMTLTKSGTGTWTLSNGNTYSGVTNANGGALVLANATALPGGIGTAGGTSALTFNGGVIGLGQGDFTRSLAAAGTVTGVTFTGNGGWAAYGADRVVNLGGGGSITWATANTGLNGKILILGNATATHMVDLQNPLDLGAAVRTVQVDNGAAAIDGTLSGILSGTGGALTKTGTGTLALTASNGYTAGTTVSDGTLKLGAAASIATSSGINLAKTAVLDTTAQSFTMLGSQAVTFNIDPAATGASGRIKAAALNITNAVVTLTASAALNDPVYILADYTSLTGTQFATVTPLTGNLAGYTINYAYNGGTQIALTLPGGYDVWATTNAGGQASNLDFDNDGVANGLEYFMGQTGSTFTPNPSVMGGKVTWPYDATTSGITYQVLSSTALSAWAPVSPQPVPSGGTLQYILPTATPKLFIRLEVVTTP